MKSGWLIHTDVDIVVSVTVLVGSCKHEHALDTSLMSVRFSPLGASVQDAMISDAGIIPAVIWRLRNSVGAGACVIVVVTVSMGTVTT